jgi:hypothetical protein
VAPKPKTRLAKQANPNAPQLPPDLHKRWETFQVAIRGICVVLGILASSLPLWIVARMVRDLAGKQTVLSVGFTATASMIGVAAAIQAWRSSRRTRALRDENIRLAERSAMEEKTK